MEEISILRAHLTHFSCLLQDKCWYLSTDFRFLNVVRWYDSLLEICDNVRGGHIFLMLPFSFLLTTEDQTQMKSYLVLLEFSVTADLTPPPCLLSGLVTPGHSHTGMTLSAISWGLWGHAYVESSCCLPCNPCLLWWETDQGHFWPDPVAKVTFSS